MSQLQCRAAPWGGHCSFYIFPEIFRLCATCPPPLGEGVWRLAILTVGGRPLPLGGEGGPPPAFSSAGAGRVRGWWACAPPFAVHIAPLKALGNDHATSSTLSRNPGTAVRCLWFQGIDPLAPRPLSPKGERGEYRNSRGRPLGRPSRGKPRPYVGNWDTTRRPTVSQLGSYALAKQKFTREG